MIAVPGVAPNLSPFSFVIAIPTMSDLGNDRFASRQPLYQLVGDLVEGIVLLDPDGRLRWANRAALRMHGVETLEALGADVDDYRSRFDLYYRNNREVGEGRSPMERLLEGEAFDDVILDVQPVTAEGERRFHRVKGKTLTQGDAPDAIALIIEDITELLSAQERFERSFNANPAPALICRLDNQRFSRANQGFLDMTGLSDDQIIDRSIYELDVFAHSPQRDASIRRLDEGKSIPQTEAVLKTERGGGKSVIVAGQPIEVESVPCMLLTFTDLEPIRQAESALRQSQALFATAFQMSPVPTALAELDSLALIEVNDAFGTLLDHNAVHDLEGAFDDYAQLSLAARRNITTSLQENRSVRGLETQLLNRHGETFDCLVSAELVVANDKRCVLLALVDITAQKRTESELYTAIDSVMQDASWLTRTIVDRLSKVRPSGRVDIEQHLLADLSVRERDVLGLICRGLSDKSIARELSLAHSTVRNYVASLYQKLGVHSRTEAIVMAQQYGFRDNGD